MNLETEMRQAGHAVMQFADETEEDEVVIALELFAGSSDSTHSARAPAPALLLQGEGERVREMAQNQRMENRGELLL
jgi:alpha/beta superfamily hydrolase